MEWILVGLCALCGVSSFLSLLYAAVKLEGPQSALLIVVGSVMAVATGFLTVFIMKGLVQ